MTPPDSPPAGPFRLLDGSGRPYRSRTPGTLGGYRRGRLYGRLDCPSALRALARGDYAAQRVFFADRAAARSAGYRPCAVCLPVEYREWKQQREAVDGLPGADGSGPRRSPLVRGVPDPGELSPPAPHTGAELTALLETLSSRRPRIRSIAVGHARFPACAAAAAALAEAWEAAGGEVRAVVDWPEQAASWLRPARRFAACAPDAWVVAGPARGLAQLSRRLYESTDWDPGATFGFHALDPARLVALAGRQAVEGMRGVSADGCPWEIHDGGVAM